MTAPKRQGTVLNPAFHETAVRALNSARGTRRPTRSGVQRSGPGSRIATAAGHMAENEARLSLSRRNTTSAKNRSSPCWSSPLPQQLRQYRDGFPGR
jgi:hypothetical protein